MPDIASSDVAYTARNLRRLGNSKVHNRIQLVFGDGALTVPAGGIPLLKGKLGCPNTVESLVVVAKGTSGYSFQYVPSSEKLVVLLSGGAHTHSLFLNNADQTDGATFRVNAAGNRLGANTGADITVAGVTDTTGVGGILQNAGSVGVEASTVAIAAQTIEVEVIGW